MRTTSTLSCDIDRPVADIRFGVVALKVNRKKASEHPAFGKTKVTPVPSLSKSPKKPKRPKR